MSMEEDFEAIKNLNSLIQNKIQETNKLISGLNSEQILIKEKQKKSKNSWKNKLVKLKNKCKFHHLTIE